MATKHLDLEEQEQLDQLKHIWNRFGNLITGVLIVVLGGFAAWKGYQYWQGKQSVQAAAMFDEVVKVAGAGDAEKSARAFTDMKERYASTAYTAQAGLLIAKNLVESGKPDAAKPILKWVADNAADVGYASLAKLRLSAVLMDAGALDEALGVVSSVTAEPFLALAADHKGDILFAQGKKEEAKAQYLVAWKAFDAQNQFRTLVEFKLNALGVNPEPQEVTP